MRQQQIPGTETTEPSIPEIDDAIDAFLAAKQDQRDAAETTKIRHASLLERMQEHGVERYPFLDPATGKKKHVVCDRTPKAKTVNAPRTAWDGGGLGEEVGAGDDGRAALDPFSATRGLLDQARELQAAASVHGNATGVPAASVSAPGGSQVPDATIAAPGASQRGKRAR